MKKCPNCGKITDRKFCSSCGTSLIDVPEIDEQMEKDIIEEVQDDEPVINEAVAEDIVVDEGNTELKMEMETEQIASSAEEFAGNEDQKEENTTNKIEVVASSGDEKTSKQPASGKKKILIVAIAAVAVIVLAVVGISASNAAKAKAAQEAYDNAVLTMRTNSSLMNLDVAGYGSYFQDETKVDSMEELINLTNSVWHDSIYELNEDDTYKYIKGTSDFNGALTNLYASTDVVDFNKQLSDHMDLVKTSADLEMANIPDSLSDAKAAYVKVITAYQALVTWCEWPNGSYSTYMEQSQQKYDEFYKAYNEFDVLCPQWENPEDTDDSSNAGDA